MVFDFLTRAWVTFRSHKLIAPRENYKELRYQSSKEVHWAYYYARKLLDRKDITGPIKIQTSMSPTGYFHIGNFRDTLCAYLVQRALHKLGREAHILLSFDDYDAFRTGACPITETTFDFGGFPLAVAKTHASTICQAYIRELKLLGICPTEADENGKTDEIKSSWATHYQHERYTSGQYDRYIRDNLRDAKLLAHLLGVSDPHRLFVLYCKQCGRSHTTILSLNSSEVRYFCTNCYALTSITDLSQVKPYWKLDWALRVENEQIHCEPAGQDHCAAGSTMDRTQKVYSRYYRSRQPVIVPYGIVRQFENQSKIAGSRGNGLRVTDLLSYFPPVMILWLYARKNCLADLRISLTGAHLFSYYAEFDNFLLTAERYPEKKALYELLSDLPLPSGNQKLPGFRTIIGLVNSSFYDRALVARTLKNRRYNDCPVFTLEERIDHALNWIASYGKEYSWLLAGEVSQDHLPRLSTKVDSWPLYLQSKLSRQDYAEIYFVLFKTLDGPPFKKVLGYFGEEKVVEAIQQFFVDGQRPLREALLRRLKTDGLNPTRLIPDLLPTRGNGEGLREAGSGLDQQWRP